MSYRLVAWTYFVSRHSVTSWEVGVRAQSFVRYANVCAYADRPGGIVFISEQNLERNGGDRLTRRSRGASDSRRGRRGHGGVHAPDPVRRRARGDQAAAPGPHLDQDDARPDL